MLAKISSIAVGSCFVVIIAVGIDGIMVLSKKPSYSLDKKEEMRVEAVSFPDFGVPDGELYGTLSTLEGNLKGFSDSYEGPSALKELKELVSDSEAKRSAEKKETNNPYVDAKKGVKAFKLEKEKTEFSLLRVAMNKKPKTKKNGKTEEISRQKYWAKFRSCEFGQNCLVLPNGEMIARNDDRAELGVYIRQDWSASPIKSTNPSILHKNSKNKDERNVVSYFYAEKSDGSGNGMCEVQDIENKKFYRFAVYRREDCSKYEKNTEKLPATYWERRAKDAKLPDGKDDKKYQVLSDSNSNRHAFNQNIQADIKKNKANYKFYGSKKACEIIKVDEKRAVLEYYFYLPKTAGIF